MNAIEQAKKLLEENEIEEARRLLLDIAGSAPDTASAWLLLSGIATRTGDWDLGVKSFGELVRLRPASSLASSGLVQSYANLGRKDEALSEIRRFKSAADPTNDEARTVIDEHDQVAKRLLEPDEG